MHTPGAQILIERTMHPAIFSLVRRGQPLVLIDNTDGPVFCMPAG